MKVEKIHHYTWFHKRNIRQDELRKIYTFAELNPDHRIMIWTDGIEDFKQSPAFKNNPRPQLSNVSLKHWTEAWDAEAKVSYPFVYMLIGILAREIPAIAADMQNRVALHTLKGGFSNVDVAWHRPIPQNFEIANNQGILSAGMMIDFISSNSRYTRDYLEKCNHRIGKMFSVTKGHEGEIHWRCGNTITPEKILALPTSPHLEIIKSGDWHETDLNRFLPAHYEIPQSHGKVHIRQAKKWMDSLRLSDVETLGSASNDSCYKTMVLPAEIAREIVTAISGNRNGNTDVRDGNNSFDSMSIRSHSSNSTTKNYFIDEESLKSDVSEKDVSGNVVQQITSSREQKGREDRWTWSAVKRQSKSLLCCFPQESDRDAASKSRTGR